MFVTVKKIFKCQWLFGVSLMVVVAFNLYLKSPYYYFLILYLDEDVNSLDSSCNGFSFLDVAVSDIDERKIIYYVEGGELRYFFIKRNLFDISDGILELIDFGGLSELELPVYLIRGAALNSQDEVLLYENTIVSIYRGHMEDELFLRFISGYRTCGIGHEFGWE